MFSHSVQYHHIIIFGVCDAVLGLVIGDECTSSLFFEVTIKEFEMIYKKYNIDDCRMIIELEGILDSIVYIYSISVEYPFYRTLVYGVSQTICAFIEKLLRKVFMNTCDIELLDFLESQGTLGTLLASDEIKNILGVHLVNIITYEMSYLQNQEDGIRKDIGMNWRNRLIHISGINISLAVHLFNILVIIFIN